MRYYEDYTFWSKQESGVWPCFTLSSEPDPTPDDVISFGKVQQSGTVSITGPAIMNGLAEKEEGLFWDRLLKLIEDGRVIPIVGQDLLRIRYNDSDELLYPLLARLLAKYLKVSDKDLDEGDEINTVAIRWIEKGEPIADIYFALNHVMEEVRDLEIPEPLLKLADIRHLKLFVSMTFDSLLENALNKIRFDGSAKTKVYSYNPRSRVDVPDPLNKMAYPAVYHLFGKLSSYPSEYAATQEDTLEFLHSLHGDSGQPKTLFDELNNNSLLILGCSFNDWLARFFIRFPKRTRLSEVKRVDYVADRSITSDRELVLFLNRFSSSTNIYEGGPKRFIDELHQRWKRRNPAVLRDTVAVSSPSKNNHDELEGAVFVSYASQDRDQAIRIAQSLENEGIDVFLDRTALQAGDDFDLKIQNAINSCSLFMPLISQNAIAGNRRYLFKEWKLALEEDLKANENQVFIMPVVLDDTPKTEDKVLSGLRKKHWATLPDGEATTEFLTKVKVEYRKYQKGVLIG